MTSSIPNFTISDLFEAGVHYGHKKMRWNPKMAEYIYGEKDNIHILNLNITAPLLKQALTALYDVARNNGKILFVGTKKQSVELISEAANRCGQHYVNHRWLGGMLTNWKTIESSIKRLEEIENNLANDDFTKMLTKKEVSHLSKQKEKLEMAFGGIRKMNGIPNIIFVLDTNKEHIAIKEAKKLNIPIVGVVDSNSDPTFIDYPIPGNDDATQAIKLYLKLVSDAILAGIQENLVASGVDLGEVEDLQELLTEKQLEKKDAARLKKSAQKKKTINNKKDVKGNQT